jgi:hypothetical protein
MDQQSRDPVGLCRLEEHGMMEWISVQACADLAGLAQWNRDCVCGSLACPDRDREYLDL